MILTERIVRAVAAGEVGVAYRRWARSWVTAGSEFRTVAGVVRVETIEVVPIAEVTDAHARLAGYASLDDLTATFRHARASRLRRNDSDGPAAPDAAPATSSHHISSTHVSPR